MNFSQFLNETPSPAVIPRSGIKNGVPSYESFMKKDNDTKFWKCGYWHEFDMYQKEFSVGPSYQYAIVDKENKKVIAFSKLAKSRYKNETKYSQTLLWKEKNQPSELIYFVFNQIIDDLKFVTSDDIQTAGGKAFWKKLCKKYVNSPFFEVGYIDEYNNRLVKFKSNDDFEEEFERQYKDEEEYNVLYIKSLE